MARRIERYGNPFGGGWAEWPAGLIDRITAVSNVHRAMSNYYNYHGKNFGKDYPGAFEIVTMIWKMRKEFNYRVWQ